MASCAPPDSDRRIILITFDSLRADQLAASGAIDGPMPAVDEVAAQSIVFTRAYSPAPLTFPALAGMMTGRVPSETGVVDDIGSVLSTRFPRLAPHLLEAGWATGAFANAGFLDEDSGILEGFLHSYNPAALDSAARSAGDLFSEALRFLEAYRKAPTFVWIHVFDTHYPYAGTGKNGTARYRSALARADVAFAAFRKALQTKGLAGPVQWILTADHGEGLGASSERTHGVYLSDETLHVPLIFHIPGAAARHIDDPVGLIDLGLTISQLAGAGTYGQTGTLGGRSLADRIVDPADSGPAPDRPIFAETYIPALDYAWPARQRVLEGVRLTERSSGSPDAGAADWDWPAWPEMEALPGTDPGPAEKRAFLDGASRVVEKLENGDPAGAARAAADLEHRYPDVPMAARLLSASRRFSADLDGAIRALTEPLASHPSADLAAALALLLEDAGRESAAAWATAVAHGNDRPRFRIAQAEALAAEGQPDEAVRVAEAVIGPHPRSASLNAAVGRIAQMTGHPEDAFRMFVAAIGLSAGSSLYHRSAAVALESLGKSDEALRLLADAQRIDIVDRLIQRDIGDIHAAQGDIDKATQAYRASLPPGTPEADARLAVVENLLRTGQVDAAGRKVAAVLSEDPDSGRGHYIKAQIALRQDDRDTAEKELLEALRTGGEEPTVYYGLARLSVLRDDENAALAYLEKVFASGDPAMRRVVRDDDLLNAPERSAAVKTALERYLSGARPAGQPSS
ncbi:MAG: sulfatase-like hydrolase/transferase [Acidobacteriota bacterium]